MKQPKYPVDIEAYIVFLSTEEVDEKGRRSPDADHSSITMAMIGTRSNFTRMFRKFILGKPSEPSCPS